MMRRLSTALVLATALFLAGCETLGLTSPWEPDIVAACETATSALKVATVFRTQGKLSVGQISSIDSAVLIITPICGSGVKPSSKIALSLVESAVLTLAAVNTAAWSK